MIYQREKRKYEEIDSDKPKEGYVHKGVAKTLEQDSTRAALIADDKSVRDDVDALLTARIPPELKKFASAAGLAENLETQWKVKQSNLDVHLSGRESRIKLAGEYVISNFFPAIAQAIYKWAQKALTESSEGKGMEVEALDINGLLPNQEAIDTLFASRNENEIVAALTNIDSETRKNSLEMLRQHVLTLLCDQEDIDAARSKVQRDIENREAKKQVPYEFGMTVGESLPTSIQDVKLNVVTRKPQKEETPDARGFFYYLLLDDKRSKEDLEKRQEQFGKKE